MFDFCLDFQFETLQKKWEMLVFIRVVELLSLIKEMSDKVDIEERIIFSYMYIVYSFK